MWTCGRCKTVNLAGGACETCVVKVDKVTTDRNYHAPHYKGVKKAGELVYKPNQTYTTSTSEEAYAREERKRRMADARKRTDELLSDAGFDISLSASRQRLEKALALASEIALRRVENGMALDGDPDLVMKVASMYRTLANTVEAKDPSEMSEEELRKQANK